MGMLFFGCDHLEQIRVRRVPITESDCNAQKLTFGKLMVKIYEKYSSSCENTITKLVFVQDFKRETFNF